MNKELIKVEIGGEVVVEVQPNVEHEWVLSSKDVAEGYGLSASSLRSAKSRYSDELLEGTHWVVADSNTLGGTQQTTYWTKEGVVMLGFFIKTPSAKEFRRWASNYIVSKQAEEKVIAIPMTYVEALQAHMDSVIKLEEANQVIALQAPKVELYDDLTHANEDTYNDMTLSEVGKELGYKPKSEFIPMLRKAGVIFMNSTEPKSLYTQKRWFRGTPVNNGTYTGMSWKVTPKGFAGMLKKFERKGV